MECEVSNFDCSRRGASRGRKKVHFAAYLIQLKFIIPCNALENSRKKRVYGYIFLTANSF